MENVAPFQGTKCRSFSLTGSEKFLLGSSCASSLGGGRKSAEGEERGGKGNQTSTTCLALTALSLAVLTLLDPHRPQSVLLLKSFGGSQLEQPLPQWNPQQNLSAHQKSTWGFPGTPSPAQDAGSGQQEGHCPPRVFRSREGDEEEQPCAVYITPKKEKTSCHSPEAAPKEFTRHSKKKKKTSFFFPTYGVGCKAASRCTRGKKPILLGRAHCCQTARATWARAGSRSGTGKK